ncbi:GerMN domain-containing protein [Streptomyces sp. NPDC054841]
MRRLPTAVAALAASAALLLTGCGIQETDVIEAGGPATIEVFPGNERRMLLFFRSPEGELLPVSREPDGLFEDARSDPKSMARTLAALFRGPTENERAAGLTTGLPVLPTGSALREAGPAADGGVEVTLSIALDELDETALRQLICTIAYAEEADARILVHLRGTDSALEPAQCDADVDASRAPRPESVPGPTRMPSPSSGRG